MFLVIQCIGENWAVLSVHAKREEAERAALMASETFAGTFCVAEKVCQVLRQCRLEQLR